MGPKEGVVTARVNFPSDSRSRAVMVMRCALFLLLLCSTRLSSTVETGHESEPDVECTGASVEPGSCMLTEETLVAAINASTDGALTEAVVNCFAYRDGNRSLYNAIVSGMDASTNGTRYFVECANDLLFLTKSMEPFTNLTAYCARCQDSNTTNLCAPGRYSDSRCRQHEIGGQLVSWPFPFCDVLMDLCAIPGFK